jgi:hypothetical protein
MGGFLRDNGDAAASRDFPRKLVEVGADVAVDVSFS